MSTEAIADQFAETILAREDQPVRFEKFCADLYSVSQGVQLVTTSKTWDLGRDAKSIGRISTVLQ